MVDNRGTAERPLVVNSTLPPENAADLKRDSAERAWRHKVDEWTIGASLATIVVLIVQAFAFAIQAHRLKQSVDEMKNATRATQSMAIAEQQTVLTMDRTARMQLRAYVFLKASKAMRITEPGSVPRVELVFCNYGQTPAHDVAIAVHHAWGSSFETAIEYLRNSSTTAPLAPSGNFTNISNPPDAMTQDQVNRLGDGSLTFFVFGKVSYKDVFGRDRHTNFRLYIGGPAKLSRGVEFLMCDEGNETEPRETAAPTAAWTV